ncbi:DNA-binding response regulator, partial [Escherichia coli]
DTQAFLDQNRKDPYDFLILISRNGKGKPNPAAAMRKNMDIPILCIVGPHDEDVVVESLNAGANDYLIRPIRRMDLMTRV